MSRKKTRSLPSNLDLDLDLGFDEPSPAVDDEFAPYSPAPVLGPCISKGSHENAYQYVEINGSRYNMDDSIIFHDVVTKKELAGKLSAIFVMSSREDVIQVEIYRFVRPEETPQGRKPFHKPQELLRSNLTVVTEARRLLRHCTIETKKKFESTQNPGADSFFFVDFFDFYSRKTSPQPPDGELCRSIRRTWIDKAIEEAKKAKPLKPPPAPLADLDDDEALERELNIILETGNLPSEIAEEAKSRKKLEVVSLDDSKENSVREEQKQPNTPSPCEKKKATDLDFTFSTPATTKKTPKRSGAANALSSPIFPSQFSQVSSIDSTPFAPSPIKLSPFKAEKSKTPQPLSLLSDQEAEEEVSSEIAVKSLPLESEDLDLELLKDTKPAQKGRLRKRSEADSPEGKVDRNPEKIRKVEKIRKAEKEIEVEEDGLELEIGSPRKRLKKKSETLKETKAPIRIDLESSESEVDILNFSVNAALEKPSSKNKSDKKRKRDSEDEGVKPVKESISNRTRHHSKDPEPELKPNSDNDREPKCHSDEEEEVSNRTRKKSKVPPSLHSDDLDLSLDSMLRKESKDPEESDLPPTKKRRLSSEANPELAPPSKWTSPRENAGSKDTKQQRKNLLNSFPKVNDLRYDSIYIVPDDTSNPPHEEPPSPWLPELLTLKTPSKSPSPLPLATFREVIPSTPPSPKPIPTKKVASQDLADSVLILGVSPKKLEDSPKQKKQPTPTVVHIQNSSNRVVTSQSLPGSSLDRMLKSSDRFSSLTRKPPVSRPPSLTAANLDLNSFQNSKKRVNLSKTLSLTTVPLSTAPAPRSSSISKPAPLDLSDSDEKSPPKKEKSKPQPPISPPQTKNSKDRLKQKLLKESPPLDRTPSNSSISKSSIVDSAKRLGNPKGLAKNEDLLEGVSTQALLQLANEDDSGVDLIDRVKNLGTSKSSKPSTSLLQPKISSFFSQSSQSSEPKPKKKRKRVESFPEDSDESIVDESDPAAKKRRESNRTLKRRQKQTKSIFDDNDDDPMDESDSLNDFIVADDAELSQGPEPSEEHASSDGEGEIDEKKQEVLNFANDVLERQNLAVQTRTLNLRQSFEVFVQYLVSHALDPEDFEDIFASSTKEKVYFAGPIQRIEDEVLGKKDALMSSSAWIEGFKMDLERFPQFRSFKEDREFTGEGIQCQACHRRNHNATVIVILEGQPYDARRFWTGHMIDNPRDDVEVEEKQYRLGKHCANRTQLYHSLQHYKSYLYKRIKKEALKIREDDPDMGDAQILEQLLDKPHWLEKYFTELKELTDAATEFGIEEKGV